MDFAYLLSLLKFTVLHWLPVPLTFKEAVLVETTEGDFEVLDTLVHVSDGVFWKMRKHNTEILCRLFPYPVRVLLGGQLYVVAGKKVLVPSQGTEYEISNLLSFRLYGGSTALA